MATITKTVGTQLLALQESNGSGNKVIASSAQDVSTKLSASVFFHFGRTVATALGVGPVVRVEASSKASGHGHWYPLAEIQMDVAACDTEALTALEPVGESVLAVSDTTGFTIGQRIYLRNTNDVTDGEFHTIERVNAGTSIEIEDTLVNAQDGASGYTTILNEAVMQMVNLDLASVSRIRIIVNGEWSSYDFAIEAHMVTADSIG